MTKHLRPDYVYQYIYPNGDIYIYQTLSLGLTDSRLHCTVKPIYYTVSHVVPISIGAASLMARESILLFHASELPNHPEVLI